MFFIKIKKKWTKIENNKKKIIIFLNKEVCFKCNDYLLEYIFS